MTFTINLPSWAGPILWMIAGVIVACICVQVFALYQLGHMDERYRDQIKWAWQRRRENR